MPFNNLVSIKACYSYTEDSQQKAWKEHTIWNNIIMCNIGTSCHIRGGGGGSHFSGSGTKQFCKWWNVERFEKLTKPKFFNSVVCNPCQSCRSLSLFLCGLLFSLLCISIFVKYDFQVSFKITQNTVTVLLSCVRCSFSSEWCCDRVANGIGRNGIVLILPTMILSISQLSLQLWFSIFTRLKALLELQLQFWLQFCHWWKPALKIPKDNQNNKKSRPLDEFSIFDSTRKETSWIFSWVPCFLTILSSIWSF